MKHILLPTLLLLAAAPLMAIHSLRVGDPRTSWTTQQGTIEEAVLSVRPEGLYWQYGLYLEFSARGTYFNSQDSLEVVLQFDLPADAIMHDSWLWIGDDIVQADILDVWSATAVYEGIVNRRQDPSLLRKLSATQYELRVFPMKANETRKVKITWLMPTKWTNNKVSSSLPVDILNTSKHQVIALSMLIWPDADWQQPEITSYPEIGFSFALDSVSGAVYQAGNLTADYFHLDPQLSFPNPMLDGFFLRCYDDGPEGFYQLAVAPQHFLPTQLSKKIAVLLDFQDGNGGTREQLLAKTREYLHEFLGPQDNFNLFFSNIPTTQASLEWVQADSLSIETVFNAVGNPISGYSHLLPMLFKAIQFVQDNGNDGMILLISNNNQIDNTANANTLINNLMDTMDPALPFHIIDFFTGSSYYYVDNIKYYGNEYLYRTLAQFTLGNYSSYRDASNSIDQAFFNGFSALNELILSIDLHTTLASGICYGRFFMEDSDPGIAFRSKPILQVGRYQGAFPFRFELSGVDNGELFQVQVQVNLADIPEADTLTREMWFGKYIQLLESGTQSNGAIFEILENSLPERVLSRYSAFLCLEDTSQLCPECYDESQLVDAGEPGAVDSLFMAWPNPFVDAVQIRTRADISGPVRLEIYGTNGQLVHWQEVVAWNSDTPLRWDGRDTQGTWLAPGAYIAILRTGNHNAVLKLVKASSP